MTISPDLTNKKIRGQPKKLIMKETVLKSGVVNPKAELELMGSEDDEHEVLTSSNEPNQRNVVPEIQHEQKTTVQNYRAPELEVSTHEATFDLVDFVFTKTNPKEMKISEITELKELAMDSINRTSNKGYADKKCILMLWVCKILLDVVFEKAKKIISLHSNSNLLMAEFCAETTDLDTKVIDHRGQEDWQSLAFNFATPRACLISHYDHHIDKIVRKMNKLIKENEIPLEITRITPEIVVFFVFVF